MTHRVRTQLCVGAFVPSHKGMPRREERRTEDQCTCMTYSAPLGIDTESLLVRPPTPPSKAGDAGCSHKIASPMVSIATPVHHPQTVHLYWSGRFDSVSAPRPPSGPFLLIPIASKRQRSKERTRAWSVGKCRSTYEDRTWSQRTNANLRH